MLGDPEVARRALGHLEEGATVSDPMVEQVMANPKYLQLLSKRAAFGWTLTALI